MCLVVDIDTNRCQRLALWQQARAEHINQIAGHNHQLFLPRRAPQRNLYKLMYTRDVLIQNLIISIKHFLSATFVYTTWANFDWATRVIRATLVPIEQPTSLEHVTIFNLD